MTKYNASSPLETCAEELESTIRQLSLDKKTREIFKELLLRSAGDGIIVRGCFDGDAPSSGTLHRKDHEAAVIKFVSEAELDFYKKEIALDLAHFGYKEGYRTQEYEPESFGVILDALGVKGDSKGYSGSGCREMQG